MSSQNYQDEGDDSATRTFYLNPQQLDTTADFITVPANIDPMLNVASIYDIPAATTLNANAMMASHSVSLDQDIQNAWAMCDTISLLSATSYSPPPSLDSNIDPRSLVGFGSTTTMTLDTTSQDSSLFPRTDSASSSSLRSAVTSPPPLEPPRKKRRGRRPSTLTGSPSSNTHAQLDDSSHTQTQRPRRKSTTMTQRRASIATTTSNKDDDSRQAALERNRIAAAKCRTKRNAAETELTSHERGIEDLNSSLKADFSMLKEEILTLKAEIHRHAGCNCDLIQQYLGNEAKRYVDQGGGTEYGGAQGMSTTA